MNRQYQDPRYQSGPYQNPNSNTSQQQSRQFVAPLPTTTQAVYPIQTAQHGLQQPHLSGSSGSYPPHGQSHMSFPEQYSESSHRQRSSTGHSAAYIPPSQSTHNSTVLASSYQQAHQDPYGYPASEAGGSSSGIGRGIYSAGSSVTGGTDLHPHYGVQSHSGGHTLSHAHSQDRDTAQYDDGYDDYDSHSRTKAPGSSPMGTRRPGCRFPHCNHPVFFDRRVNELREWCSDEHMRAAMTNGIEKPCKQCRVWPRRYGYKLCSGQVCRYTPYGF